MVQQSGKSGGLRAKFNISGGVRAGLEAFGMGFGGGRGGDSGSGATPPPGPAQAGDFFSGPGANDYSQSIIHGPSPIRKSLDFIRGLNKKSGILGVNFTLSSFLKQSQIFTSTTGSVFQGVGAVIDWLLMLGIKGIMKLFEWGKIAIYYLMNPKELINKIWTGAKNVASALWGWIGDTAISLKDWLVEKWVSFWDWVGKIPGNIATGLGDWWQGLWGGETFIDWFGTKVKEFFKGLTTWWNSLPLPSWMKTENAKPPWEKDKEDLANLANLHLVTKGTPVGLLGDLSKLSIKQQNEDFLSEDFGPGEMPGPKTYLDKALDVIIPGGTNTIDTAVEGISTTASWFGKWAQGAAINSEEWDKKIDKAWDDIGKIRDSFLRWSLFDMFGAQSPTRN